MKEGQLLSGASVRHVEPVHDSVHGHSLVQEDEGLGQVGDLVGSLGGIPEKESDLCELSGDAGRTAITQMLGEEGATVAGMAAGLLGQSERDGDRLHGEDAPDTLSGLALSASEPEPQAAAIAKAKGEQQ